MSEALHNFSLVDAAKITAGGHISSVALTELALERLKRLGPKFNCTITLDAIGDTIFTMNYCRVLGHRVPYEKVWSEHRRETVSPREKGHKK